MGEKYFDLGKSELMEMLNFLEEDIENVRRVAKYIEEKDIDAEFRFHGVSKSAEESARKTDLELDQIVKTLIFKSENGFVAVLCPGDKRVSEEKMEDYLDSEVRMAKPQEVKEQTGYIVGGVPPFDLQIPVLIDKSIQEKEIVNPAAGSKAVGVTLKPEELEKSTDKNFETLSISE